MSIRAGLFIMIVLLLQGTKCLQLEDVDISQQDYVDEASDVAVQRAKRQLTTICVEIKPSGPKEEPFFMCKGADFPTFQHGTKTTSEPYGKLQYAGGSSAPSYKPDYQPVSPQPESASYSAGHSQGGGSSTYAADGSGHFQTPAAASTKSDASNYQSFPAHDSTAPYSSSNRGNGKTPTASYHDIHQGYQQPSYYSYPTPPAAGRKDTSTQQQPHQQKDQIFPVPYKESGPVYEAPTTKPTYDSLQKSTNFPGYESLYETADHETPAQPAFTPKPATRFGSSSKGYAPTYTAQKTQVAEAPYSHRHTYETPSAADGGTHQAGGSYASSPAYNSYQRPPASSVPAPYAHTSPTAALPVAEAEKSIATKAIPYADKIVAAAFPYRPPNRLAAMAAVDPYLAATMAKSTANFLKPTDGAARVTGSPHFGEGTRFGGSSDAGAQYQMPYLRIPQTTALADRRHSSRPSPIAKAKEPSAAPDRYRTMTLDDHDVFGMPDWGFSADELNYLRGGGPVDEPTLGIPHVMPSSVPPELQARTPQIPEEHLNDPVMQAFYSSLQDAAPASPLLAAPPSENPLLSVNYYVGPPEEHAARNSYKPTGKPASCSPYKQAHASTCTPSISSVSGCGNNPTPPAPQQYVAASDTDSSYVAPAPAVYNCKSSCHAPSVQPVFIALPCYGQSPPAGGYNQQVAAVPPYVPAPTHQNPVTYNQVGMASPGLGLFGRPLGGGLLNLGINPFWRPFDVLGLVNNVRQNVGLANPNVGMPYQHVGVINQGAGATNPNLGVAQQHFDPVNHNLGAPYAYPGQNLASAPPAGFAKTQTPSAKHIQTPAAPHTADFFKFNAFPSPRTPPLSTEHPSASTTESSEISESLDEKQVDPKSSPEFNSESEEPEVETSAETNEDIMEGTQQDTKENSGSGLSGTTVTSPPNDSDMVNSSFNLILVTEPAMAKASPHGIDEVPSQLEEESRKAYKSLLNAARSFSHDAKAEAAAIDEEMSETEGRMRKRQNAKAATSSNGHKRQYVQKL